MKIINSNKLTDKYYGYLEIKKIPIVKRILNEVKTKGDQAVKEYTKKFDNISLNQFEVSKEEIKEAYQKIDEETITALKKAAENIKRFAQEQFKMFKDFELNLAGNVVGQRIIPLRSVGCYVPGGRYPLPSTALMTIIPAKVVGVEEIIVCSPKIKPETIVAADIAGADRIFCIGGIQAVGAMAYGTKSVPKVDKIVGPGNKYVTAAKKEVYGTVGIDFIAGPSEVLIIADGSGDSELIVADLLAQAEHDPNSRCDLLTASKKLAQDVNEQLRYQSAKLKTRETAEKALANSSIVIVDSLEEAAEIANKKSPEHLEIQIKEPEEFVGKLRNFGSLFIGEYSAVVFGDYCSGINHTLPTNGAARYTGGLSVKDFVKIVTYQQITEYGAQALVPIATKLASIEGLDAHRRAAELRLSKNYINNKKIMENKKNETTNCKRSSRYTTRRKNY